MRTKYFYMDRGRRIFAHYCNRLGWVQNSDMDVYIQTEPNIASVIRNNSVHGGPRLIVVIGIPLS